VNRISASSDAEDRHAAQERDDIEAAAAGVNRVHGQFPACFSSRIGISRAEASEGQLGNNSPGMIRPD
jgi:hypothetical protein